MNDKNKKYKYKITHVSVIIIIIINNDNNNNNKKKTLFITIYVIHNLKIRISYKKR